MITDIQIENFRCFNKSHIKGFKRINLIGGKNNSGKTAFLEAVYLNVAPSPSSIRQLKSYRQTDVDLTKESPLKAWDYLFLLPDKQAVLSSNLDMNKLVMEIEKNVVKDFGFDEFTTKLSEYDRVKEINNETNIQNKLRLLYYQDDKQVIKTALIAQSSKGVKDAGEATRLKKIHFIPSSFKTTNSHLAEQFDIADLAGNSDKLLKAFQIVDNSILGAKTMSTGKPTIYLQTKKGDILPIGLFGDAINKIANLILKIANNPKGIILIDEIENGIHYSNQEEIWEAIFKLAAAFDVQIFATTHSIEMIKAFANVLKQNNNAELGGYFEFYRHIKTNEIAVNEHVSETLIYELENNVALRGE